MFVNAFLALCSAVGTGTAVEISAPGYARQAVRFASPKNGVSVLASPYVFAGGLAGPIAGRALYDAPMGGRLLLVLPFAQPRPGYPVQAPDAGDVGAISLRFDALASYPDGDAYVGPLAAGTVVGTCWDEAAVVSRGARVNPTNGTYVLEVNSAPLSTGVALSINRGLLGAA